jgi:hypothetical protein
MKHWRHMLATCVYNHCNIPIYFCNICVKQLKHTSKASETFQMYTCNMHHILVCPPLPSASGRRRRSKRQGQRASVPQRFSLCQRWRQAGRAAQQASTWSSDRSSMVDARIIGKNSGRSSGGAVRSIGRGSTAGGRVGDGHVMINWLDINK